MKILFMSDLLPYYKETLARELAQKGIKNFKLSDSGDNSSEEVNFIIYSPVIKNRVKLNVFADKVTSKYLLNSFNYCFNNNSDIKFLFC